MVPVKVDHLGGSPCPEGGSAGRQSRARSGARVGLACSGSGSIVLTRRLTPGCAARSSADSPDGSCGAGNATRAVCLYGSGETRSEERTSVSGPHGAAPSDSGSRPLPARPTGRSARRRDHTDPDRSVPEDAQRPNPLWSRSQRQRMQRGQRTAAPEPPGAQQVGAPVAGCSSTSAGSRSLTRSGWFPECVFGEPSGTFLCALGLREWVRQAVSGSGCRDGGCWGGPRRSSSSDTEHMRLPRTHAMGLFLLSKSRGLWDRGSLQASIGGA